MRLRVASIAVSAAAVALAAAAGAAPAFHARVVTVGTEGNEPLIAVAPDGTLYISALQFLYRSTDHGTHWTALTLPPESGVTEYKTDSDIAVDPSGRLYYTFDWPYAGSTSVCTSTTRGDSWSCSPAAMPGGTDRMWVTAPTAEEALFVTNEGTYQPILSRSTNAGATWTPVEQGGTGTNPYTTRPFALASGPVFQAVNANSDVELDVYDRSALPSASSAVVDTHLPSAFTGPSGGISRDGTLYVTSEAKNDAGGRGVVVAHSRDRGQTWQQLPPLPGTTSGTAIFTALATGPNGHVGVLAYWTPTSGDPSSLPDNTQWYAVYYDSADANAARPRWRRTVLEKIHHTGLICRGLACDVSTEGTPHHTNARFAGDFLGVAMDAHGTSYLSWMGADGPPFVAPVDPSTVYGVIHFATLPAAR